ncbi:MAG TPA: BrnT family toxin [Nitrospirota bacterium]|nr:BrnT family toxin [Nitrospirota bacterium]
MRFIWDEDKNRRNLAKHKISFETARLVFDDPFAISIRDQIAHGEERWQTMGLVGGIVVVLVAHTYTEEEDDEVIRIISARKATSHERRQYEQNRK